MSFRASTGASSNVLVGAFVLPVPAGIARGDTLFAAIVHTQATTTAPGGWATPTRMDDGVQFGSIVMAVFEHFVTDPATEPANYTFVPDATTMWAGIMGAYDSSNSLPREAEYRAQARGNPAGAGPVAVANSAYPAASQFAGQIVPDFLGYFLFTDTTNTHVINWDAGVTARRVVGPINQGGFTLGLGLADETLATATPAARNHSVSWAGSSAGQCTVRSTRMRASAEPPLASLPAGGAGGKAWAFGG